MEEKNSKFSELKTKLNNGFEKVGMLTRLQRLLICVATFALIMGGYYYFVLMPKNTQLKTLKNQHQSQVDKLNVYKRRAASLIAFEKQMAEKQEAFSLAMGALPDKRELPSLLTGISRAGSKAGLMFHLFQPDKETDREFYTEIPVSIKVEGQYHQITDFFFQITKLNRIVNIDDVVVKALKGSQNLEMSCKAVTYMFLEKTEPETSQGRRGKK